MELIEALVESPLIETPERRYRRRDAGARVLVVEDIPVTREFLRRLLEESGYQVTLAGTAGEAQTSLMAALPDLVVLDLLLPDFNGLEVCRFLRTLAGGEDIPVLIITVDERPSSHAEAVRAGADDFLRKPLLPVELQTRVRSLMRLRQLRGELRQDREAILNLQAQKEELLQFVVHDLKNMLSTLLVSVELLEAEPAPGWVRQRQRIEDTARSMHGMVQSMLDLSLREQGGLVPHKEILDLTRWMEQRHLELEALVQRRSQTLNLRVEPGLTLVADSQMLQRVLSNLVENASKFGPPKSEILVLAFQAEAGIRIQVVDCGEGIPAEKKALVFDRFIRLENGAGVPAGRGLGLAFCRMVMEIHGGRIWVEDNGTQGSRFCLELPILVDPI
jgi:signal transduction histidine kinase